jgi:hypothetical protein
MDALTLETLQAGGLEPAVAGPGGGDHAACSHLAALHELDAVVAVRPVETNRLLGHGGPGAELVGLDQGAAGELEAGQTRGEAQVVLDPGAGASLPAKRHRLQGQGREALRSPVDRRAKAGRSRPDHDQVVGSCRGGVDLEANGPGKLGVGGVLQDVRALPDRRCGMHLAVCSQHGHI